MGKVGTVATMEQTFSRCLGGVLVTSVIAATAACARPGNLNVSLDRASDHNAFRIRMESGLHPIPISRVHQWSVHLTGADGAPISGAVFKVDGGMPQHGHGLPTAPRAEASATPGTYVIKGMKFSMTGWWVLKLDIRAPDGRTDKITFNVIL